ncbi:MAG: 4-hydroxy-3-methylbut-2-enyl diphosphate reductase [Clostridiales bacterium]|nr:4-hydroxy-3-methylbut-2-enyl diphosphate reductase [Clostridiales bacterium]
MIITKTMLRVIRAEHSGFCFGVKRAVEQVLNLRKQFPDKRILTVGELIHNNTFIERLHNQGISVVEESDLVELLNHKPLNAVIVIRTHGIRKATSNLLSKASEADPTLTVVDCTCPFVKKIYGIMQENTSDDTFTILFGNQNHPETIGTSSFIKGNYKIVTSLDEAKEFFENSPILSTPGKIVLAAQTTQNHDELLRIKDLLFSSRPDSLFFDTICNVTGQRQSEIEVMSKESDVVIVVGGSKSSNTQKLYHIAKDNCDNTYLVNDASELPKEAFIKDGTITVTAGASTPDDLIDDVISALKTK